MSKTPDMVKDIREFHEKFGLEYNGKPRTLPPELAEFRRRFLEEELSEFKSDSYRAEYFAAMLNSGAPTDQIIDFLNRITTGLEGSLDALVDLVYVALGTAYLQGFDFAEAWRRVHEANMKKVRVERKEDSKRGSTFDVVKPEGWEPPSHTDLVRDHIHAEVSE